MRRRSLFGRCMVCNRQANRLVPLRIETDAVAGEWMLPGCVDHLDSRLWAREDVQAIADRFKEELDELFADCPICVAERSAGSHAFHVQ